MLLENDEDIVAELQNVVNKLPPVHKSVLCFLLVHLASESGSIDRIALGHTFGPVLLKSGNPTKTNDELKVCSLVVTRLISHHDKLFAGAKEG